MWAEKLMEPHVLWIWDISWKFPCPSPPETKTFQRSVWCAQAGGDTGAHDQVSKLWWWSSFNLMRGTGICTSFPCEIRKQSNQDWSLCVHWHGQPCSKRWFETQLSPASCSGLMIIFFQLLPDDFIFRCSLPQGFLQSQSINDPPTWRKSFFMYKVFHYARMKNKKKVTSSVKYSVYLKFLERKSIRNIREESVSNSSLGKSVCFP